MSTQSEGRATGGAPATDPDAEREIDLRRVWDGIKRQWWIVAAGVVVGIILGGLWSLSGGSTWEATAKIAPGQAFSPAGSPVFTYLTNQTAINSIATSAMTVEAAAAKAGIPVSQLRGRISTDAVNSTGTTATRNAVLVNINVRLNKKKKAEDAADAVAKVVRDTTTNRYVRKSIAIYTTRIANFQERLTTLQKKIDALTKALAQPGLSLNDSLLLSLQLDQAQATQGQTIDSLTTAQQQQILAEDVQRTQIIQFARAVRTSARNRRTSILVGALLGLIGGMAAAIVVDRRAHRVTPA